MTRHHILLFTHLEFFQFLKDWWWLLSVLGGGAWGQYKWVVGRADALAMEAKKDRDEQRLEVSRQRDELNILLDKHHDRLCQVEEVDRTAYPAFQTLISDFKKLEDTVKNHHEMRFTGIVVDQDRTRELYEEKLKNHTKRVDDLEKRLDKIDMKLDKILDVVMKNTTH